MKATEILKRICPKRTSPLLVKITMTKKSFLQQKAMICAAIHLYYMQNSHPNQRLSFPFLQAISILRIGQESQSHVDASATRGGRSIDRSRNLKLALPTRLKAWILAPLNQKLLCSTRVPRNLPIPIFPQQRDKSVFFCPFNPLF